MSQEALPVRKNARGSVTHSDNWEEKIMTGNKEAYFYLASSLEKIFPDTDCVKKNDQHTISIFKGELPAFLLVYGNSSNRCV